MPLTCYGNSPGPRLIWLCASVALTRRADSELPLCAIWLCGREMTCRIAAAGCLRAVCVSVSGKPVFPARRPQQPAAWYCDVMQFVPGLQWRDEPGDGIFPLPSLSLYQAEWIIVTLVVG